MAVSLESASATARPVGPRPAVRGVILDFGGVMTEPLFHDLDGVEPMYARLVRRFLEEMRDVYHLPTGAHELHLVETGRIGEREFFERLCRRFEGDGVGPVDPMKARQAVFGRALIACGAMVDAVRQLRASGLRTALLTNISRDPITGYASVVPVDELFDAVVDSSKVGLRKPDPAIYRLACERIELEPQECLYVDDLTCNVDGAEAIGLEAMHCTDPVATADVLVRRLLGHGAAEEVG